MSQEFLNRLKNYLDGRLKDEAIVLDFKPFEIYVPKAPEVSYGRKWEVMAQCFARVRFITEDTNGVVTVESKTLDKAGDYIGECLVRNYRYKLAKARGNNEGEERILNALDREKERARDDYLNRRNFEKHLKKSYWHAFLRLLWFDEVARRISKEYGVEVKVSIDDADCDSSLISEFDASNMDEKRKFEEIKRRVEALIVAYRFAYKAYSTSKEERKEFLEFCGAILAKYGIKRKKRL
ncbi:MAG: hypothetical protein QXO76_09450 [Thermoproteota archaeon]